MNFDIPEGSLTYDNDLDITPFSIENNLGENRTLRLRVTYFMNEKSMNDGFLVKDSRIKMGLILVILMTY